MSEITKDRAELERLWWFNPKHVHKCKYCGDRFGVLRKVKGRKPKYCSPACKQKAYRDRKAHGSGKVAS